MYGAFQCCSSAMLGLEFPRSGWVGIHRPQILDSRFRASIYASLDGRSHAGVPLLPICGPEQSGRVSGYNTV